MTFSYSVARTAIHPPFSRRWKGFRLPFSSPFLFLPLPPSLSLSPAPNRVSPFVHRFRLYPSRLSFSTPLIYVTVYRGFCHLAWEKKKRGTRAFETQTAITKSISMKYYYTHASLFPPLFKTWPIVSNRVTVFSFVVRPPSTRVLFLLLVIDFTRIPQKWQKGGWISTGFFDFRPSETLSLGRPPDIKYIFEGRRETPDWKPIF